MAISAGQENNIWIELAAVRERQHALVVEVSGITAQASFLAEKISERDRLLAAVAKDLQVVVQAHDKDIALMKRDISGLKEIESSRTAKLIAVVGLTVPIGFTLAQFLWWLCSLLVTKKV